MHTYLPTYIHTYIHCILYQYCTQSFLRRCIYLLCETKGSLLWFWQLLEIFLEYRVSRVSFDNLYARKIWAQYLGAHTDSMIEQYVFLSMTLFIYIDIYNIYIYICIYTHIQLICNKIQRTHTVLSRSEEQQYALLSLILSLICLISYTLISVIFNGDVNFY